MAGPTWPSPTSSTSRPRCSTTSGGGQFADHTAAVGLAVPSRDRLGFGIAFLDVNNDGRLDLITANGHVNDYRPEVPYAMPVQLLLGGPAGRLTDVTARAGPPFQVPHLGRGLAIGDLDNDGRVDAVMVAQNEPLVYLHNRTDGRPFPDDRAARERRRTATAWAPGSSSRPAGSRRVSQRLGGGSFLSANDPRLHFGIGPATRDRSGSRFAGRRAGSIRSRTLMSIRNIGSRRVAPTDGVKSIEKAVGDLTYLSLL